MSVENLVERALTDYADAVSVEEPDVEALVARGMAARRRHRTRIAACVAAVAVIVGAALGPMVWRDAELGPVKPPEVTTTVTPPRNLGIPWGPDVTYYLVADNRPPYGVRPFADTQPWPGVDVVQSFTTTSTGVVYVNADSDIVFEGWDHQTRVLGNDPRTSESVNTQLLGNPSHDLVAWAEDEGERIAVVVVQASTGETLARTVLPVPTAGDVIIRSLDAERLYVLIASERGNENWTWKWSTEGSPSVRDRRPATDVAGGVWAVIEEASGEQRVRFETDTGRLIRRVYHSHGEGQGSLSPDGKIWFNRRYKTFVDPATGRAWSLKPGEPKLVPNYSWDDSWGWTGTTEITFVILSPEENLSAALVKCDVLTLRCAEPLHPQLPAGSFQRRDVTLPSH